ncbi:hypothetical protein [Maribacter luteus]|uniref:Uncharacterized protein n=1 Tax=Maribacter luteus TaxID=2594478 RepID=A0A6I2MJE0_9FLAO|nr:hypothetical protein [Maribacter luteus]MRX63282.1 hypothetical protein [Maribacter luteus]|tara:strand:- start:553 stop:927 length:375 start_codon:yes stop_codon:yes gene_type:complete
MKYAEYKIGEQNVVFSNSILGIESVIVNGKKVSEGFSWFGKDHCFKIGEDQYRLRPSISFDNFSLISISVYKNGDPVKFDNMITKSEKVKLGFKFVVSILLAVVVGIGFGMGLTKVMDGIIGLF